MPCAISPHPPFLLAIQATQRGSKDTRSLDALGRKTSWALSGWGWVLHNWLKLNLGCLFTLVTGKLWKTKIAPEKACKNHGFEMVLKCFNGKITSNGGFSSAMFGLPESTLTIAHELLAKELWSRNAFWQDKDDWIAPPWGSSTSFLPIFLPGHFKALPTCQANNLKTRKITRSWETCWELRSVAELEFLEDYGRKHSLNGLFSFQ